MVETDTVKIVKRLCDLNHKESKGIFLTEEESKEQKKIRDFLNKNYKK